MVRSLVELAVKRRVSVMMVAAAVVAFGWVGFSRLGISLLPDIAYPSITVQTDYPDAAPGEVENLVTKPVEEAVGVLRGLREIHSVSRAGRSEVTLDFGWDADMDDLALEVREKLDRVELPDEAEQPLVLRYDPALDPILRIALIGDDELTLIRRVAEKTVKESLETIPGVAAARVKGGDEEEVQVEVDQGKLAALGIPFEVLARVIATSNINRPGGALKSTSSQYLVRTLNEYDSLGEIAALAVNPRGGPPIRLGDLAEVSWGTREREEIIRVDGRECVEVAVYKEGDANSVEVARLVREELDFLPSELPAGMEIRVLFDQARFIESAIREVREALLLGGALAMVVVLLFLRDFRPTLIIATSIPLSIVACFVLMYRLDVSMNIMSLGGLTLGIGMLVDSSIVVLEAIDRRRKAGVDRLRAAIEGTTEVGGAVIASTLTTIAVFFPIVFVEGIAGQLFRDQALTVTFSLLASLIVAVTVIPMLSSLGGRAGQGGAPGPAVSATGLARPGLIGRGYERLLGTSLRHRWLTLGVAAAVFGLTMTRAGSIGRELVPALTQGEFFFEVTMPEGTPLAATDAVLAEMERVAAEHPEIETAYASVGTRLVSGGLAVRATGENLGQLNVVLRDRRDDIAEERVAAELRAEFERIPSVDAKLGRPSFFSLKTPIEMLFFGDDLAVLRTYTERMRGEVIRIPGLTDVRSSVESGNPELSVVFDRELLARLGLTIEAVSKTLHDRVQGVVVSHYTIEDRQVDIRLRNRESDRGTISNVENLVVAEHDGVPLKLSAVAAIDPARGPAEIHRIQQSRVAIVSGSIAGRNLGDVVADAAASVERVPPPPGIEFAMGGQSSEMAASFSSLRFMFLFAVFLVYLVMAGTFESLIHPLLILFTIPLALVGVVWGMLASGSSMSVISLIGTIFLAGVVVNNAIVLVDAINRGRREGLDKLEAVMHAGRQRLRPILMTTLTTALALLPMAIGFGEGAELRAPMAIVVVWGLLVSTVLTLVVIPAAYMAVPSGVRTLAQDRELEAALREHEHA